MLQAKALKTLDSSIGRHKDFYCLIKVWGVGERVMEGRGGANYVRFAIRKLIIVLLKRWSFLTMPPPMSPVQSWEMARIAMEMTWDLPSSCPPTVRGNCLRFALYVHKQDCTKNKKQTAGEVRRVFTKWVQSF